MSINLIEVPSNALRIAYALYLAVDEHGNATLIQDRPCAQGGPVRVDIGNAAIPALRDVLALVTCPGPPSTVDVEQIVANALHSDDEWGGLHTAEEDIRAAATRYVGRRIVAEMPATPGGTFAPSDVACHRPEVG